MRRTLAFMLFVSVAAGAQNAANASAEPLPPPGIPPLSLPVKAYGPACAYPDAAQRDTNWEMTQLEFHISTEGKIADAVVRGSTGNTALNDAASKCLSEWRVDPGEATKVGRLWARIFWKIPAGASPSPTAFHVGTFTVYRLDSNSTAPVPARPKVSGPMCPYPDSALRAGIEGSTSLGFRVDAEGRIIDTAMHRSSENPDLDNAAIQCLRQWRVDPSDATQIGMFYATVVWKISTSAGESPVAVPVGAVTIGHPNSCEGFYPADAANAKIGGKTWVRFHVTTDGSVSDPEITQSSNNADLDRATLDCVRTWRYMPARKDGQPIDFVRDTIVMWAPL